MMLASIVTSVPTRRLTTIVRVAMTVPVCGKSIPKMTKSEFILKVSPMT